MIVRKVKRRIKRVLSRILIRNKRYKPKGVYNTIEQYTEAVKEAVCVEAYPPFTSYLDVSEEFRNHFIGYVETTMAAEIPAARVVAIPDGRVFTDNVFAISVISGDNHLIGELSYDLNSSIPEKNAVFKQNYFKEPEKYSGNVLALLIGEGGIENPSHYLLDSISRIALVKKVGWYDKIDWFLIPSYKYGFHREVIKMLGINESKIIAGDLHNHVQADTLIATTYVRYHEHVPFWCPEFLRTEFLPHKLPLTDKKFNCPFVYISRKDSPKRRVLNEDALTQTLIKYGFQSFELSSLSFQEKITLFSNAEIIIATIGAGQINLVFSNKNTHVLELMAEDFAQPIFNDLANKVGLKYDYLICKSDGKARTFKQGEKLNLIVNIEEVERKLSKIIALERESVTN